MVSHSPHVLVTDYINNRAGHLLAIQTNSLQKWLQPAHIALHVGVKEGEHLT